MQRAHEHIFAIIACLTVSCNAHWRLTVPMTRKGPGYENDPLGSPVVCRNSQPNANIPRPTYDAGSIMDIKFEGGGHVGDCSVYLSYDVNVPTNSAQFVKIANLPDCRSQINTLVPILLPSQLPDGNAILRWDQYALHQGSFIEWYVQCADIEIRSSSSKAWDSFNKFSMTRAYPSGMSNYRRNIAVPGDSDFYMTGPACVDDSINQCELTARGTRGFSGVGGGEQLPSPVPPTVPAPSPIPSPTSPSPVTCVPIGDCPAAWCTQDLYVDWCGSQSSCPSPYCKTVGLTPTPTPVITPLPVPVPMPTAPPMPMPLPTPMPVPVPVPPPSPSPGRRCVPTLESFYNDPAIYGPICEAQERGNVCTAPMCRWEAALVQERIRRHRFLGLALVQGGSDVDKVSAERGEF